MQTDNLHEIPKPIFCENEKKYITNWLSAELAQGVVKVKALSKIEADNILNLFYYFSEKIRLGVSCKLSTRQLIHMKCQAVFSLKNKYKKIKMSSATVVISTFNLYHSLG